MTVLNDILLSSVIICPFFKIVRKAKLLNESAIETASGERQREWWASHIVYSIIRRNTTNTAGCSKRLSECILKVIIIMETIKSSSIRPNLILNERTKWMQKNMQQISEALNFTLQDYIKQNFQQHASLSLSY